MTTPSWPSVLGRLLAREELSSDDAAWAFDEIMGGEATDAQISAFAVLLRAKGETPGELAGLVRTMLARSPRPDVGGRSVDIVGTGGDRAHTVNISTMSALVVAGSGRQVVKHGNRAASSRSGGADVLEELGVVINLPAEGVARTAERAGIGFCFAPVFHAGMRHAGSARRELGVPTVFNLLGPLSNPARPTAIAAGCADERMAPVMARMLADRGDTALVVHGDDGLDELTTTTTSHVWVASAGHVHERVIDPSALDIAPAAPEALRGGDAAFNAAVVHEVLAGRGGAVRDAVLLNAGAGIAAFDDDVDDLDGGLARGIVEAARSIDAGAAAQLLERWVRVSREVQAELTPS